MILAIVLLPAAASIAALVIRADAPRRALLVSAAAAHAAMTAWAWSADPPAVLGGWLALDAAGKIFLGLTSALFLAAAVYGVGYLAREEPGSRRDFEEGVIFSNAPEAVFTACLLIFLSTMSLVAVSRHFGVLWVAIEATTLSSAPLIYFHRHHRSLEATWKYLMICSVGIALALLGNFLLVVAASGPGREPVSMLLGDLISNGPRLHAPWVQAAFLLLLVGYGTKMGLAPLHTWLPDAHSESPSLVSALLSGALLNCAFLGILRGQQVLAAAGEAAYGQSLLVVFGLVSMGFAAVFVLGQADFKRMLAYSSVEHMGILALGVGLGGVGIFGSMLHAVNHSLTKGMLFLLSGNILASYRTKEMKEVRGVARALPATGALWIAGFLAITGAPPFGLFVSEILILKAAIDGGRIVVATAYLTLLAIVFIGMATAFLGMAHGAPNIPAGDAGRRETSFAIIPPFLLSAVVLLLGLWIPGFLAEALRSAAAQIGGG